MAVPHFLTAMRVSDASVGFLVVAAAFLGCVAPVYTDALQSLKRFRALAAVEVAGAVMRFLVMLCLMPIRALAGYFDPDGGFARGTVSSAHAALDT